MLISCPNCTTNFSVPDSALGAKGRNLKCAKCGHKWFQSPMAEEEHDLGLDENSFPPTRQHEPDQADVRFTQPRMSDDIEPHNLFGGGGFRMDDDEPAPALAARGPDPDLDVDLDEPPIPDLGPRASADGQPADLDLDGAPQPIPDMFASGEAKKKGTGFLWLLLILLLLGGGAGGAYYFQDKVVEAWPPAHDLLTDMGLRREKPGAGLELRNAGTPERFVHNDTEVLIVRGIIANISDRQRPVPTLKLVLLDKDRQPVQEKLAQPPVTALDPSGTAGFRITLERPDANAVEVNVLFVDGGETR